MKRTLLKFKHIEDTSGGSFIEATFPNNAVESLQILKLIDSININNNAYTYVFSEFVPALSDEMLDVVYVFVDGEYKDDLDWLN